MFESKNSTAPQGDIPEENMKTQRKSLLMRVAGAPSQDLEEKARAAADEAFKEQPIGARRYKHEGNVLEKFFGGKKLKDIEKPHSPEDRHLIQILNEELEGFVRRYQGQPVQIPDQAVHFIDIHIDRLDPRTRDEIFGASGKREKSKQLSVAFYNVGDKAIVVNNLAVPAEHPLMRAHILAHEMLHINSFQSASFDASVSAEENGRVPAWRRCGIHMAVDGTHDAFKGLNEAITEEMTKKFMQEKLSHRSEFADDLNSTEKFKEKLAEEKHLTYADGSVMRTDDLFFGIDDGTELQFDYFIYAEERGALRAMMQKIQETYPDKFASEEDVFNEFARAYFSGRLLALARLVEGAYGEKSFAAIGRDLVGFITAHERAHADPGPDQRVG